MNEEYLRGHEAGMQARRDGREGDFDPSESGEFLRGFCAGVRMQSGIERGKRMMQEQWNSMSAEDARRFWDSWCA